MPVPIKTMLIANRAEIALRIQATSHALGIKTIAIYSPEDQLASYVYRAHQAYKLSKSGFAGYLDQEEIIAIARQANADAIHPGYGFLSENSSFAQKVLDAGMIWVGPSPESIRLMGDKSTARDIMAHAGVPIVPGITIDQISAKTNINIQETKKLSAKEQALIIGYPVILKDPKSGGGKAMRRIDKPEDFDSAWNTVISEAAKLTGSTTLVLEKYITHGRHIEVQVAGDGKNFVHMYERECSIQRRHQKIIEEAPCVFLPPIIREQMHKTAVLAAQTVKYNNIGTVEFIVTPDQKFYFLEMNTRLQVEHSVTEMTTGIDLVALQIAIAQTNTLLLSQENITQHAHAIQSRIYAENPAQKFAPSTGIINNLAWPASPFARIDHDLDEGTEITPFFDPMIAKITTWGTDRTQAINNMRTALENTNIQGITTNITLLRNILTSNEFVTGDIHTQLLHTKQYFDTVCPPDTHDISQNHDISEEIIGALAVLLLEKTAQTSQKILSQKSRHSSWKDQYWK